MRSFTRHCLVGIEVNHVRVEAMLQSSLMLVTALTPHIGYDRAATIAHHAESQGCSLREAALTLGWVTAQQFDEWIDPHKMLGTTSVYSSLAEH
jgi:fumarate hydratase class II